VSGGLGRRNVKVRNFLFNDAVSRYKYMASVVDQWTSMEHCWNDTDGGKAEVLGWKRVRVTPGSLKVSRLPSGTEPSHVTSA